MEHIAQTAQSLRTKTSSLEQQSSSSVSTASTPPEYELALLALINRARALNGWGMRDLNDLEEEIAIWYETFSRYDIPVTAYTELFNRGFDVRAGGMSRGDDPKPMDATLLVSQWIGENGLQKELRRREEERGRTLSANAGSVCKWCLGTGWRQGDVNDPSKGVTRCDHSEPQGNLGL